MNVSSPNDVVDVTDVRGRWARGDGEQWHEKQYYTSCANSEVGTNDTVKVSFPSPSLIRILLMSKYKQRRFQAGCTNIRTGTTIFYGTGFSLCSSACDVRSVNEWVGCFMSIDVNSYSVHVYPQCYFSLSEVKSIVFGR